MSEVTITFRAKRDEYYNEFTLEPGYKVPQIKHAHVSFNDRDSRVQLFLQGLSNQRVTESRLRTAGVKTVAFESDPSWNIKPIGNGFMADVSRTISV